MPQGVAEKEDRYGSLGSGSAYAEYILSRFFYVGIKIKEAICLVIYTIEEIKKIDPNVGGRVHISIVEKKGIRDLSEKEIKNYVRLIEKRDELLVKVWDGLLLEKIDENEIEKIVK